MYFLTMYFVCPSLKLMLQQLDWCCNSTKLLIVKTMKEFFQFFTRSSFWQCWRHFPPLVSVPDIFILADSEYTTSFHKIKGRAGWVANLSAALKSQIPWTYSFWLLSHHFPTYFSSGLCSSFFYSKLCFLPWPIYLYNPFYILHGIKQNVNKENYYAPNTKR